MTKKRWEPGRYSYDYFLVGTKTYIGAVGYKDNGYEATIKAPLPRKKWFAVHADAIKWVEARALADAKLLIEWLQ